MFIYILCILFVKNYLFIICILLKIMGMAQFNAVAETMIKVEKGIFTENTSVRDNRNRGIG